MKRFFEYLQGEAEHALERLHDCAEIDVGYFLNEEEEGRECRPLPTDAGSCPKKEAIGAFTELQGKLSRLTKVTNTFFENLMRGLENGLVDVGNNLHRGTMWLCLCQSQQYFKNVGFGLVSVQSRRCTCVFVLMESALFEQGCI